MTILDLLDHKRQGRRLSMVTCYDHWSARLLNQTPIDVLLVGDSLGMVMHGHASTLPVTLEMMGLHVAAVARGAPDKLIVADLPFLSYRKGLSENVTAVQLIMQAGAHAVKLEGRKGNEALIAHLVEAGVPVVGHLGLTPQFMHQMGGFKVQGRGEAGEARLAADAAAIEACGASALVLECIPAALARQISQSLTIPTIGIGAGAGCDGQVLVLQDLLGLSGDFKPKFLRRYLDGDELFKAALTRYHQDVVDGAFPTAAESFE